MADHPGSAYPIDLRSHIASLIPYPMAYHPGSKYRIDEIEFITRLKALYSHWNKHKSDLWSSSDVLAIATPPPSDDLLYLKSSALHIWLLGYVFPETIMVFMQKQIHFLCSQKKASLLNAAKAPAIEVMGVEVVMHVKAKNDDGSALMETIFRAIHAQSKVDGIDSPVVGYIAREAPEGNLLEKWAEKLKNVNFQLGDVTNGLSDLFAVKGKEELVEVKKAAFSTTNVMNNIVVIDEKNEETARPLAGAGTGAGDSRVAARTLTDLIAYKNVNDLPPPKDLFIQIDRKNEAVLLPIYGSMVPFHISTISGATSQLDVDRTSFIRIFFNVPGTPFIPHDACSLKFQGSIYLKDIQFLCSKDWRYTLMLVKMIKKFRRQFLSRESKRAKRATLVTQERLKLAGHKFNPIRLYDLWLRLPFGGRGRKMPGTLEAHVNGFRFSTTRQDEGVDIIFGNIKHAFFQPAENEMITLLHFHLHNYIKVGNKITKDVQFYVEVIGVVQTLGGGKRSAYDPDAIEEGQRERDRDRKNKVNMDFQSFVNRVNDLWRQPQFNGLDLEFDQPLREFGFHGVPYKSSAFIVPTSTCLVQLIETPFLVVTQGEIEIVNLERVGRPNNFDMTIVFKDLKKDVLRIDSIPSTALDGIKDWLDTKDFKYYESRVNRNWRFLLDTIIDDPDFIEDGGWEFLNLKAADSETDEDYDSSDEDPKSDSEDDNSYSESESLVESEEEDGNDFGDSEEEKGKTWKELEREVTNADREKGAESDSEEDRKRRKMKAFGKSRAGPSSSVSKLSKLR